jgi:hypothetical protein
MRAGIGGHGDGGDFHRLPVDRAPQLALALGFRDVVAVDPVADGDGRDRAIHDPLHDRGGIRR